MQRGFIEILCKRQSAFLRAADLYCEWKMRPKALLITGNGKKTPNFEVEAVSARFIATRCAQNCTTLEISL
jgi:hypothetical protein